MRKMICFTTSYLYYFLAGGVNGEIGKTLRRTLFPLCGKSSVPEAGVENRDGGDSFREGVRAGCK